MMPFIDYISGKQPVGKPIVSIYTRGLIDLNRSCVEQYFRDISHLRLRFDPERRIIALKPEKEGKGLVQLRADKAGRGVITALDFFHKFGIDYSQIRKFDPRWNDEEKQVEIRLDEGEG
jgi:hypothetical protein